MASIDSPTDVAVTEGLDIHHTYHYRQMADPAELAGRYVTLSACPPLHFQRLFYQERCCRRGYPWWAFPPAIVGTFYLSSDLTKIYKKTGDGQITPVQIN